LLTTGRLPIMLVMKSDVNYLSRLANLKLTEEEERQLPTQLDKIIDWVGQLAQLEIEAEEAEGENFTPVDFTLRLEPDEPGQSLPLAEVLAMAPEKEGDFFKVPRVLTGK